MKGFFSILRLAVWFSFSLLLSYFIQFRGQVRKFVFLDHTFHLDLRSFLPLAFWFLAILSVLWLLTAKILSKTLPLKYPKALAQDFLSYLPFVFLALTPLALTHYLTSEDLQTRTTLLLLAVLFSILYLKAVPLSQWTRENPCFLRTLTQKFLNLSLPKKLIILFLAALILYNAGSASLSSKGITFSGDEPHYLLITYSLLHDRDFDLAENYARKDYTQFTIPQAFIRSHAIPGARPESRYSFHSPGISFCMLPFYALGSLFGRKMLILILRFGMSIFGALLGLQLYLYAREEWKKEKLALGLWLLFSLTSPVFFYSIHIYPEIVVALLSFTVFRIFRFSPSLSKTKIILCGFLLSSFIWFHALKYLFIQIPLILYCLWVLVKKHRKRTDLVYFLAFPVLLTGIYFYFQYTLYGSFSISAVSWQKTMDTRQTFDFFREILFNIPLRFRWETLAGYFLDQRDGLLFYAPIYFFAFLGMAEVIRRKGRELLLLLFLAAPYVLFSAFLTQRTGYAPQARPLVAVCWGLGILLGHFLAHNVQKIFSLLFRLALFLSFLSTGLLLQYPLALYQETTYGSLDRNGELFNILSNLHFHLPNYLPSYLKIEEGNWLPNFIWLGVLLAFVALYIFLPKRRFVLKFNHHLFLVFAGMILFFGGFVLYPRMVLLHPVRAVWPSGEKVGFYGLSRVAQMREPGKFKLLEDNRHYNFHFTSWRKIQKLKIEFGSPAGEYRLKLSLFDQKIFEEKTDREICVRWLISPPSYPLKKTNLYRISIHLEKLSDVHTGLNPYSFSITPVH